MGSSRLVFNSFVATVGANLRGSCNAMAAAAAPFQTVGEQFCQHYYGTFDTNRAGLAGMYGDTSMLTFEGEQFQGAAGITQKLVSLPFVKVVHQVVKCDCHPNPS